MTIQREMTLAFCTTTILALAACTPMQGGAQGPANGMGGAEMAAGTSTGAQPKEIPLPPPPTEQACRDGATKATPVVASSATDAKQQFGQFFDAHHETFRCCFDAIDAPKQQRSGAKVTLLVKVDGTGKLKSSEIVQAESGAISSETSTCMADIAKTLSYPKPMTGLTVAYKRIFDFKGRR